MTSSEFGVREGEVTVELPAAFDAGVYFIGRIHTPWTRREDCPKNPSQSTAECTIDVDPRFAPALKDLAGTSHLHVLYWMDRAPRNLLIQAPHRHTRRPGTFSVRSPARPNPIALSVVELKRIADNRLTVVGLDCLDGTPLIDLKPYFATIDSKPDAVVGWRRHDDAAAAENPDRS